ncbi:hypothetical protein [Nitratireductor sp. ZSWI3]|uniref:hypothetical protein n=1 Tax=Nitratireductor sp. ZSWI3 TaxID=2966359 RepID=UPI00214F73A9|nr:hypothetical protein [Nitratireductor sp. ZSWI3]MCR4266159.1 hypothetical protein [Nitratireductor sp. ZSWI3]
MRRLLKGVAVVLGILLLLVVLLLSPAAYVEAFCHGDRQLQAYEPLITEPDRQRPEANTYLTYPEWHIVYAYDGLAETLKSGDEHRFDYWAAIRDFWVADCALTRIADAHGGADGATRMTIATIGVSFTLEMGLKAAYEETLGRLAALWRGTQKTPQDVVARDMAADYAAFLRQVPWYKYPFQRSVDALWAAPVEEPLRGWERRLALGAEWKAKTAYAGAIASAVTATGEAKLTIFTLVSGLPEERLAAIDDVTIADRMPGGVLIETPRYDRFTHILSDIARAGGTIEEIAGNDDIMLTMTAAPGDAGESLPKGDLITRFRRAGFATERVLISVKVRDLADILRAMPIADPGIEHVFDY